MHHKILVFLCVWLVGCQVANPVGTESGISKTEIVAEESVDNQNRPGDSYTFSSPVDGTITMKGRLLVVDPINFLPDPADGIFFVPLPSEPGAISIPQFKVGEVPQAEVDEWNGDFQITNLQPGQYVVVVLTNDGTQIPARFFEGGNLAVVNLQESDRDQIIQLDYIAFP